MKTIDDLAQVFLTVDNRLDLILLGDSNTGLTVDDDLHRELVTAVEYVMLDPDVNNISEAVSDDGGLFEVAGDTHTLNYVYNEDEKTVTWSFEEVVS